MILEKNDKPDSKPYLSKKLQRLRYKFKEIDDDDEEEHTTGYGITTEGR